MGPRILLIPSEALLLWLSSLRPRIGHSILLSNLIWSPNWGQFLWIYVCWLIRADHSCISTSKLLPFTFISLQHRAIARNCHVIIYDCSICWIKLIHVFVILDEGHLGARHQSPRFVARPFGVAQLLLVMDLLLHFKRQLSWIDYKSLDVRHFTLVTFFVIFFVFHYSGLAFEIKLFISYNMSE